MDAPQPVKYNPSFKQEADKYMAECQQNKTLPTIKGFANRLGTDVNALWTWANKKKVDEQGKETEELFRPNFLSRLNKIKELEGVEKEIKEEDKLTPKQELFCRFYTQNSVLFGNATLAYAEAYGYDLETIDHTRQVDDKGKEIVGTSEYDKAYAVCSVDGSRLLRSAKINDFLRECLNELLNDKVVDSELAKVIVQNDELDVKISGIREYNKLKQRIIEKIDHSTLGKELPTPIYAGKSTNV